MVQEEKKPFFEIELLKFGKKTLKNLDISIRGL